MESRKVKLNFPREKFWTWEQKQVEIPFREQQSNRKIIYTVEESLQSCSVIYEAISDGNSSTNITLRYLNKSYIKCSRYVTPG